MKIFIKVMKAISEPNRVKIIDIFQHKTMCLHELQAAIEIAKPTVFKQLKILEDAQLVYPGKEKLRFNCSIIDGRVSPYGASMLGNFCHWLG